MKLFWIKRSIFALAMTGVLWAQTPSEKTSALQTVADVVSPVPSPVAGKKTSRPRNRKKIVRERAVRTPTSMPRPTPTATHEPTTTPVLMDKVSVEPQPTPAPDGKLAQVSILSDPVRGKKAIFRVVVRGPAKAMVRIYDRTYNKVAQLEGEGEDLFDILWTIKKVPEGIYHFQSQVILGTGEVVTPAVQDFTIEKDSETSTETPSP